MFSSLHRQWLSWSHAWGRSGAQKGFDLAWPAVSAGTHGFHKLTTYQNKFLQVRREFTSHVSLDCWFADGDAVEAQWVWVKIYYRTNAEHMKKKKMGRWGFQCITCEWSCWQQNTLADVMIHFSACWAKAEGVHLLWVALPYISSLLHWF